jgi:hypothetical protein
MREQLSKRADVDLDTAGEGEEFLVSQGKDRVGYAASSPQLVEVGERAINDGARIARAAVPRRSERRCFFLCERRRSRRQSKRDPRGASEASGAIEMGFGWPTGATPPIGWPVCSRTNSGEARRS